MRSFETELLTWLAAKYRAGLSFAWEWLCHTLLLLPHMISRKARPLGVLQDVIVNQHVEKCKKKKKRDLTSRLALQLDESATVATDGRKTRSHSKLLQQWSWCVPFSLSDFESNVGGNRMLRQVVLGSQVSCLGLALPVTQGKHITANFSFFFLFFNAFPLQNLAVLQVISFLCCYVSCIWKTRATTFPYPLWIWLIRRTFLQRLLI